MAEDLYGALGISKGASESEIKKAYKKKARQYHPDVNKDPGAEDTFKDIQRAYSILSDPQKKAQYDQFGVADDSAGGQGFGGFGGGGFEGGGFEDIFDSFFGGSRSSGGRRGPTRGDDLRYDLDITLEEAAEGVKKEIEIFHLASCSRCEGSGAQPGTKKTTCGQCGGAGQVKHVQQTFLGSISQVSTCPSCSGTGSVVEHPCLVCHGNGVEKAKKKLNVDIPEGVESSMRLRVTGEGNQSEDGGPAGDLYVFITVKEHQYFERDGDNIRVQVDLSYIDLVVGTEVEVPTINGSAKLKIPAGTQPDTVFRLKNKGIPHLKGYGKGDQYVTIKVVLPKKLSSEEKAIFEQLSSLEGKTTKKEKKSLFDCIRRR